jgi:hypothetical protein
MLLAARTHLAIAARYVPTSQTSLEATVDAASAAASHVAAGRALLEAALRLSDAPVRAARLRARERRDALAMLERSAAHL